MPEPGSRRSGRRCRRRGPGCRGGARSSSSCSSRRRCRAGRGRARRSLRHATRWEVGEGPSVWFNSSVVRPAVGQQSYVAGSLLCDAGAGEFSVLGVECGAVGLATRRARQRRLHGRAIGIPGWDSEAARAPGGWAISAGSGVRWTARGRLAGRCRRVAGGRLPGQTPCGGTASAPRIRTSPARRATNSAGSACPRVACATASSAAARTASVCAAIGGLGGGDGRPADRPARDGGAARGRHRHVPDHLHPDVEDRARRGIDRQRGAHRVGVGGRHRDIGVAGPQPDRQPSEPASWVPVSVAGRPSAAASTATEDGAPS